MILNKGRDLVSFECTNAGELPFTEGGFLLSAGFHL